MQKNDLVKLEIEGITSEGGGVAHSGGIAVFVPGTAAGDVIEARIVKVKPRYAYARVERLLMESPDRAQPDCPAGKRCGGCALRHLTYEAEKREKSRQVQDAFVRLGGFDTSCEPIVSTGAVDGYRNKAMLPVRRKDGRVQIGFYARRTHEVIDHNACLLQPPEFALIAGAARRFLEEESISCYREEDGSGLVRHLYLRRAAVTGELMVCLVVNGDCLPKKERFLNGLSDLGLPIRSVCLNINRERTNVILGPRTVLLSGSATITDVLCGIRVLISPGSFYQVNHDAAELLYRKAEDYASLTGNETLVDLYCGIGTIGLSMAGKVKRLIGVEAVEDAVRDARRNARENGIVNAEFICADASEAAERFAREGLRPDVVILDPPRKGCGAAVLEAIRLMAPARVVMISCYPATAARDCRFLCDHGYRLRALTPVDMFPRTVHVETVSLLSKLNAKQHQET